MKLFELPTEILFEIICYIPFVQKLECMLVCHQLACLIRKHVLFHSVTIWENATFKRYFEQIQADPLIGRQVEKLVLFNCLKNNNIKKYICTLFPNTRYLQIRQLCAHGIPTPHISDKTREKLQSFRHHIEHMVDYNKGEFVFYILNSGLCLRLTTLEVELSQTVDMGSAFAHLLKNAPNIKTLKITKSLMLLETLEKVHANLPSLESLFLHDVRIISDHAPEEVTPAVTLKKLSFHDEMPWSLLEMCWLEYVCRKYPNLLYLTLSVTPVHIDTWIPEGIDVFTEEGIVPILQSVGPQLKQLKIYGNVLKPSLFQYMDDIGCQIKELDVNNIHDTMAIYPLMQSDQCKYIQSLTLRDVVLFDFGLLKKRVPRLKNLELFLLYHLTESTNAPNKRVDLGLLLEQCPATLESLLISGAELTCDPRIEKEEKEQEYRHVFQLKKIVIGEPWLHEGMSEFLSKRCPMLTTIKLYNCGLNDIFLDLSNHHLSLFEANQSRPDYLIALQVSTESKSSKFYYSDTKLPGVFNTSWGLDNVEPPELAAIKASSYQRTLFGVPFIQLKCASVLNLVLNRRLVC